MFFVRYLGFILLDKTNFLSVSECRSNLWIMLYISALIVFIVGFVLRDGERKSMSVERSLSNIVLLVFCSILTVNFYNY